MSTKKRGTFLNTANSTGLHFLNKIDGEGNPSTDFVAVMVTNDKEITYTGTGKKDKLPVVSSKSIASNVHSLHSHISQNR